MLYTPQARLDALHYALRDAGERFMVVMHDYPDPDCLASSMGMQRILSTWQMRSDIVFGGGMGRPANKAMVGLLELEIREFSGLDPAAYAGAILVDTQPGAGNNSLPENVPALWVIDNHSPAPGMGENDTVDLRQDCGATSSIVWEYLQAAGIVPDAQLATALFLGIKTDTEGLERDAGKLDIEAYGRLLPLADLELVNKVCRPPLTDEYFRMLDSTLADACRFGEAVVANLGAVDIPDLLSAMSELLVAGKGVAWALVVGWNQGRVYVSLRIRPPRKNAASIIHRTLAPEGRGGGHNLAAGGQISLPGKTLTNTARIVIDRFLQAVSMQDEAPRRLCPRQRRRRRTFVMKG